MASLAPCLCLSRFQSSTEIGFVTELKQSINALLRESVIACEETQQKGLIRYSFESLESALSNVEWRDICQHYDISLKRKGSPLLVVALSLLKAHACLEIVLVKVLIPVVWMEVSCLQNPPKQWKPWQEYIIETILYLSDRSRPLQAKLPDFLQPVQKNEPVEPKHVASLLTLVEMLAHRYLRDSYVSLISRILVHLGTWEAHESEEQLVQQFPRRKFARIDDLHGEGEECATILSKPYLHQLRATTKGSTRKLKKAPYCEKRSSDTEDLCSLIRTALTLLIRNGFEGSYKACCLSLKNMIGVLVIHLDSWSLSLACLGVIEGSRLTEDDLVRELWRAEERYPLRVIPLITEVLIELGYFDSPLILWDAMEPLVNFISDENCDASYRFALSAILTRRGRVLRQVNEFLQFTATVSNMWDQVDDWVPANLVAEERLKFIRALQLAHILGLVDTERETGGDEIDSAYFLRTNASSSSWIVSRAMFSSISLHNGVSQLQRDSEVEKGFPVMQYLNRDILNRIFSYFGYKRLVQLRYVSREWCHLSDSNKLWEKVYTLRFGIMPDDPIIPDSWKEEFIEKYCIERDARFRSVQEFRPRCCRYIACRRILKSQTMFSKHLAVHRRRIEKAKDAKRTKRYR